MGSQRYPQHLGVLQTTVAVFSNFCKPATLKQGGAPLFRYSSGNTECSVSQVNLYISELEVREGEESVYAQKDYNHLYWYMITIIIFYGIPAFQLVITYQQVCGYY